jgi:hypothetical protein
VRCSQRQQLDQVGAVAEWVRDRAAVRQRAGGEHVTVHLGHQQGRAGCTPAVSLRQIAQRSLILLAPEPHGDGVIEVRQPGRLDARLLVAAEPLGRLHAILDYYSGHLGCKGGTHGFLLGLRITSKIGIPVTLTYQIR